MTIKTLTIATRQSRLALWQAELVKQHLLQHFPGLEITFLKKVTAGDKKQDVSLAQIGGKNLFTKELQAALLQGEADIAVHSVKDLSAKPLPGLLLAAVSAREDPRDVFISKKYLNYLELPWQAIVGTASPRRQSQLLALRPDLTIKLLRGNVETRLQKLMAGEYDAIVLAAAGIKRLGLASYIQSYFTTQQMLPAIGQGAIGIECRSDAHEVIELMAPLNHAVTKACVESERAVNAYLGGDCFTPIAAYAIIENNFLSLEARLGSRDGKKIISAQAVGSIADAVAVGEIAAKALVAQGAQEILRGPT